MAGIGREPKPWTGGARIAGQLAVQPNQTTPACSRCSQATVVFHGGYDATIALFSALA